MFKFLIYIFEISLFVSIMLLFYRYLYFKLAYFKWSRYFFYLSLISALSIPFLPSLAVDKYFVDTQPLFIDFVYDDNSLISFVDSEGQFSETAKSLFDFDIILKVLFVLWLVGFVRYLISLALSFKNIFILASSKTKVYDNGFIIVKSDKINGAFSFFKYIFIGSDCMVLDKSELQHIIDHEKIHAKQLHSIDNIVFEIYRAVFWFNPISKFITANVKINHEFITDSSITGNKKLPEYSRLIVKLAISQSLFTVSNFSSEEIKSRINLLAFPENDNLRKSRFIASLPVLFIVIIAMLSFSSFVNSIALKEVNKNEIFLEPFADKDRKVISPFFENVKLSELKKDKNIDDKYIISHREITYKVKNYTSVIAISNGYVNAIDTVDNWGIKEISIKINFDKKYTGIYKNIYKVNIKQNDSVYKGNVIGITGDVRLYRIVGFKLLKDNLAINPQQYFIEN